MEMVELMLKVEAEFDLIIPQPQITPENLQSVRTLELMIGVNVIFWILERKGLYFAAAMRALRVWFVGNYRPAWIYTRRRKFLDTGSS